MNKSKYEIIIASSPNGIGIELWQNNELLLEVTRNDSTKERTITLYKKDLSLDKVEKCIEAFKSQIPWDYES